MLSEIYDLIVLFASGIILLFVVFVLADFGLKYSQRKDRAEAEKQFSHEPGINDPRG